METIHRLFGLSTIINKISVFPNHALFRNYSIQKNIEKNPWISGPTSSHCKPIATEEILSNIRYYVLCNRRISRNDANCLMQTIKSNRNITSEQSLHAINSFGSVLHEEKSSDRMKLLFELWETLKSLDVKLDIGHYNSLLKVYLENDYRFTVTEIINNLKSQGIEPNHETYRYLIQECCRIGELEQANKLLDNMKIYQYPQDLDIFNALILGYSTAGNHQTAENIFDSMQKVDVKPNQKSYTNLLCGYAKFGNISKILTNLDEYKLKGIVLRGSDILDIIKELTVNGHSSGTEQLYRFIQPSQGYGQDATNTILHLINHGYDNVAYDILKTLPRTIIPNGDLANVGDFFIKQLVKNNRQIDEILKFCAQFEMDGLSSQASIDLLWALTERNLMDQAIHVLKALQNNGVLLTPEHFRTLFKVQTQGNIITAIQFLKQEFKTKLSIQFVREVIVQNLSITNPDNVIATLRNAGIAQHVAASAVAFHCIRKEDIAMAASIVNKFKIILFPNLVRNELIRATVRTRDFDNYIRIALNFYKHHNQLTKWNAMNNSNDNGNVPDQSEALGELIFDTLKVLPVDLQCRFVTYVLTALLQRGISISAHRAQCIEKEIQSQITNDIVGLLQKHASGLSKTQLIQKSLSEPEINAKYDKIFEDINSENFLVSEQTFMGSIFSQAHCTDLSRAFETLERFKEKDHTFNISIFTNLRIVTILIQRGQLGEAKKYIALNGEKVSDRQTNFRVERSCWTILKTLAENGKVNDIYDIFDSFVNYKFIQPNNSLLGPLIKVHLINNNVIEAVNAFEMLSTRYRCTPLRNELMRRLIYDNDEYNVRRVLQIMTKQHGEQNAHLDYCFSLIECNRVGNAESILQSLGSFLNHNRIIAICKSYAKNGDTVFIERFLSAAESISPVVRNDIHLILLDCYCCEYTPKNALNLYIKIKEKNELPSAIFLKKLANFLQSKNVKVPF